MARLFPLFATNRLTLTTRRNYVGCLQNIVPRNHLNTITRLKAEEQYWHIYSAVCLLRKPVITQPMTEEEEAFHALSITVEEENSKLSNHELKHLEDRKLAELRKSGDYGDGDMDAMYVSAAENEDKWHQELKSVTPAPRITEDENNLKSTNNRLSDQLVLLVKQKMGDNNVWVLPQGLRKEGESMRKTTETTLRNLCGNKLRVSFLGNAPCGFYQYKYPYNVRNELCAQGGKIFFYKAYLKGGHVEMSQDHVSDYAWMKKSELANYFNPLYAKEVNKFILDT